jgi:hypothetical protein
MSGEDPAHERGNPTRSASHEHMGMVAHQCPGINGCLGFVGHTSNSHNPLLAAQIVIDNIMPRTMTWCNVPGVSKRAPRGILVTILS